MSLNMEYYREFVALADTLNYWEAAVRLYENQSTLSKHIKSLEKEVGYPLFNRTTRRVSLTEYGAALLPYARSISDAQMNYSTELQRIRDRENGVLTIGCIPAMAQNGLTEMIVAYNQQFAGRFNTKVVEADTNELSRYLLDHYCELAFVRDLTTKKDEINSSDEHFVRIPYTTDRIVAVMSVNHPLLQNRSSSGNLMGRRADSTSNCTDITTPIPIRELAGQKFCFIKEHSSIYDLCERLCQDAGFVPNVVFDSHRIDSILDMITNSDYIALLPERHATRPHNSNLPDNVPFVLIPIEPVVYTSVSLCYVKGIRHSDSCHAFVDFFTEQLQNRSEVSSTYVVPLVHGI